jgi:Fic family protein
MRHQPLPMERGLKIGVALGQGKTLNRANIMRIANCSRSTAWRYMTEAERILAADWQKGSISLNLTRSKI